jgi:hypothetical protein
MSEKDHIVIVTLTNGVVSLRILIVEVGLFDVIPRALLKKFNLHISLWQFPVHYDRL